MNFKRLIILLLFLIPFLAQGLRAQKSINIGSEAPMLDHTVEDINGKSLNLSQIAEQNGLLVIFWCNTCPLVSRWEDRIKNVSSIARTANIGMIALNPNERIRDRGESLSDMKRRSTKQLYNFIYALDKDHEIADAFGATKTPEVFLFNKEMKLVYKGSIDDNPASSSNVENKYLEDAILAIQAGNSLKINKSDGRGCPIKRIE